ncbi:duboraya isoform X1 [Nothobranchius furzeri]|uniref:duboraya isoform X1 n=1 Tax=Nothobranchius furzeri TaxID=105023 RepID=UPI003904BF2F
MITCILTAHLQEAPPRRSVAELAGKFKGSTPPVGITSGHEADKPVRRRPPRTLPLAKTHGDDQQPLPGVSSSLKIKTNSGLIEKLQANLALSPTPAPLKSPGLRVLPPSFTPPSPGAAPVSMVTSSSATPTSPVSTSPQTEEGPASFEAPPTAADANILRINKGRARVSLRRRPPSRRHRKSSCEDEASVTADTRQNSCPEVMENSGGRGGGGGEEEVVFRKGGQTEDSSAPEKTELCEEETEISTDVEKEDKEGVWSSSRLKEEFEEKHLEEKQEQDSEM